jgi:CRISPR-associated exonuclease Cas4
MLPLSILLILVALVLFGLARRQRKAIGMPAGRIIYADTSSWGPVKEPLYDANLGLTGRPDYIVQQGEQWIPVEVKSSRVSEAPFDSHIFQLAAYCRLVQLTYGQRPPYGILHYPNRTFAIDFTPELETAMLDLLAEMRAQDHRKEVSRSHENAGRCKGCGFRSICNQKLNG